jgi:hypothetical protein
MYKMDKVQQLDARNMSSAACGNDFLPLKFTVSRMQISLVCCKWTRV